MCGNHSMIINRVYKYRAVHGAGHHAPGTPWFLYSRRFCQCSIRPVTMVTGRISKQALVPAGVWRYNGVKGYAGKWIRQEEWK